MVEVQDVPQTSPRRRAVGGFTLIELMTVVIVIAILAAVALPAYTEYIRKSRRAEAITLLNQISQEQERWRANNSTYALAASSPASGISVANSAYYTLNIASATGTGYVATATATGSQASDTKCASLILSLAGGNVSYGRTGTATVNQCWNR
jgi:type IV pilus assembly protein PilE